MGVLFVFATADYLVRHAAGRNYVFQVTPQWCLGICCRNGAVASFRSAILRVVVSGFETQPVCSNQDCHLDDRNAFSGSFLADAPGIYLSRAANVVGYRRNSGIGRDLAMVFRRAVEAATAVAAGRTETCGGDRES